VASECECGPTQHTDKLTHLKNKLRQCFGESDIEILRIVCLKILLQEKLNAKYCIVFCCQICRLFRVSFQTAVSCSDTCKYECESLRDFSTLYKHLAKQNVSTVLHFRLIQKTNCKKTTVFFPSLFFYFIIIVFIGWAFEG
jgi:hypothetical protein